MKKRRSWSMSQRAKYNSTIAKRSFSGIVGLAISYIIAGILWVYYQIIVNFFKYFWKGIKWIYNKISRKEDNAGL